MPADDVTIGELSRALAAMEVRMEARFSAVNARLDGLQFVSREAYRVQTEAQDRRITGLEDSRKWIARCLVLVIMTSIIGPLYLALVVAQ